MNTYDLQERIRFNKDLSNVEKASLEDRKEGFKSYAYALQNNTEWLVEKIGWLLNGSYGQGSFEASMEVCKNKRMNRTAWLGVTIAALEYQCPNNYARKAWNSLAPDKQAEINKLIMAEIEYVLENEEPVATD